MREVALMRAMVLRAGRVAVEDVERPLPGPGQVLARVRACGVCGSDLHFARYGEEMLRISQGSGVSGWDGVELDKGIVMGHEFVAEVVATGPGVTGWPAGARVVSMPALVEGGAAAATHSIGYSSRFPGAYGEYLLLSSVLLLPAPEHVSDALAATTEPCAVGLHAVREARVRPEERAHIMGAGPIGLMTLLWLKHGGVQHVSVSDPAPTRRALAVRLGADLVLDPTSPGIAREIADNLGGAPRVVFECVGVPGTLQAAMDLAEQHGRVIVAGVCMTVDQVTPLTAIRKRLTLQFVLAYTPQEFAESLSAIASGAVDPSPLITRTVALDELPSVFQSLSDPRECKVVLLQAL
jgi:threonine dehydrogenase-like Zn-dependent dehydrogenase